MKNYNMKNLTEYNQFVKLSKHNKVNEEMDIDTGKAGMGTGQKGDMYFSNVKGNLAAESLSNANITCNKNGIPFDSEKPMITSGIRLGTQAATTRGFGLKEFEKVGELITKVVKGLSDNPEDNSKIEEEVRNEVIELTSHFPIYKNLK